MHLDLSRTPSMWRTSTMTKKDYILIAAALRSIDDDNIRVTASRVLAYALREDNRRFNIDTFINACSKEKQDG
jgi:hypothetical protein